MRAELAADETAQNRTLSPVKLTVLEALLAGETVTSAAERANVSRSTVHAWLRDDRDFQDELRSGRRDLRDAIQGRLLGLAEDAVDCLGGAIRGGDARAAVAVLKGLQLLLDGASRPAEEPFQPPREVLMIPKTLSLEAHALLVQFMREEGTLPGEHGDCVEI